MSTTQWKVDMCSEPTRRHPTTAHPKVSVNDQANLVKRLSTTTDIINICATITGATAVIAFPTQWIERLLSGLALMAAAVVAVWLVVDRRRRRVPSATPAAATPPQAARHPRPAPRRPPRHGRARGP
jgi:hypothetical protein